MKTMYEKMHAGELFLPTDEEIAKRQQEALKKLYEFNATKPWEGERRAGLLKEMCAQVGEGCYIEPPLHANFGAAFLHLGKGIYINYNFTLVDDTHIYIGDYTMFGPNVTLTTAGHPLDPELRQKLYQYNIPIHIGKNCWIGAGAIVMPGITIGDNAVIGAGSVVTKDIPANVIAFGNPCKVFREINAHDREYYFKERKIDYENL